MLINTQYAAEYTVCVCMFISDLRHYVNVLCVCFGATIYTCLTCILVYTTGGGHASGAGGGSSGNGGSGVGGGGVSVPAVSVGGGGGAGGRRFFPDMPVHVQHLLEERQHFDRVSPSRRTVYRKIVSGMQGSGNMSMGYHLPGRK